MKTKYTERELEKFRKIILSQIEDTKEIIDNRIQMSSRSSSNASGDTHTEEMGTESHARELSFYIAQREGKFIANLEGALKRIANNDFGVCRSCGKLIGRKRLEVVPHATLCIDCKNDKERKD